jgi:hypothetical protein
MMTSFWMVVAAGGWLIAGLLGIIVYRAHRETVKARRESERLQRDFDRDRARWEQSREDEKKERDKERDQARNREKALQQKNGELNLTVGTLSTTVAAKEQELCTMSSRLSKSTKLVQGLEGLCIEAAGREGEQKAEADGQAKKLKVVLEEMDNLSIKLARERQLTATLAGLRDIVKSVLTLAHGALDARSIHRQVLLLKSPE